MCSEHGVSPKSRKGRCTFSQGATAKRVADADEGPVGKAILGASIRGFLGNERQVRRKLVPRVPDGIGEIIGQKVDDITAVVQPFIYM